MCTTDFFRSTFGIGVYVTLVVGASIFVVIFFPLEGKMAETRTYYIAAEMVEWDYLGSNSTNVSIPAAAERYFQGGPDRIGSRYLKARYTMYNSKEFVIRKAGDPGLGILGPTIYCQVGDTIVVYFKNMLPVSTNLRMQGLEAKAQIGSPFDNYVVDSNHIRLYVFLFKLFLSQSFLLLACSLFIFKF